MALLFMIFVFWMMYKLFVIGIKASWSIFKFLCFLFILPIILGAMYLAGLIVLAFGGVFLVILICFMA